MFTYSGYYWDGVGVAGGGVVSLNLLNVAPGLYVNAALAEAFSFLQDDAAQTKYTQLALTELGSLNMDSAWNSSGAGPQMAVA